VEERSNTSSFGIQMKQVSVYDKSTGLITQILSADCGDSDWAFVLNSIPKESGYVEGAHDHMCRKVDLVTNEVVKYQPESPGPDYECNENKERWKKTAEARLRDSKDKEARIKLQELSVKMVRPLSELMINPNDVAAKAVLSSLQSVAESLRADVVSTPEEVILAEQIEATVRGE
jgi:hypothetical protein